MLHPNRCSRAARNLALKASWRALDSTRPTRSVPESGVPDEATSASPLLGPTPIPYTPFPFSHDHFRVSYPITFLGKRYRKNRRRPGGGAVTAGVGGHGHLIR